LQEVKWKYAIIGLNSRNWRITNKYLDVSSSQIAHPNLQRKIFT